MSSTTVTWVFTERPTRVTKATALRVLDAADQLDYKPQERARVRAFWEAQPDKVSIAAVARAIGVERTTVQLVFGRNAQGTSASSKWVSKPVALEVLAATVEQGYLVSPQLRLFWEARPAVVPRATVAGLAGVSPKTVSWVTTQHAPVSAATALKVIDAADVVGWEIPVSSRKLVQRKAGVSDAVVFPALVGHRAGGGPRLCGPVAVDVLAEHGIQLKRPLRIDADKVIAEGMDLNELLDAFRADTEDFDSVEDLAAQAAAGKKVLGVVDYGEAGGHVFVLFLGDDGKVWVADFDGHRKVVMPFEDWPKPVGAVAVEGVVWGEEGPEKPLAPGQPPRKRKRRLMVGHRRGERFDEGPDAGAAGGGAPPGGPPTDQDRDDPTWRVEQDLGVAAGVSDGGLVKSRNEDRVGVEVVRRFGKKVVILVSADGVSGSTNGQEAAEIARDAVLTHLRHVARRSVRFNADRAVLDAIELAQQRIVEHADQNYRDEESPPECTVAVAVLEGDGWLTTGGVGDSEVRWVPLQGDGAHRLTEPHTAIALYTEQYLREDKSQAEAERLAVKKVQELGQTHAISHYLGKDGGPPSGEAHVTRRQITEPGMVLVCTDGVPKTVSEAAITAAVRGNRDQPIAVARELVEQAKANGETDNITAALGLHPMKRRRPEPRPDAPRFAEEKAYGSATQLPEQQVGTGRAVVSQPVPSAGDGAAPCPEMVIAEAEVGDRFQCGLVVLGGLVAAGVPGVRVPQRVGLAGVLLEAEEFGGTQIPGLEDWLDRRMVEIPVDSESDDPLRPVREKVGALGAGARAVVVEVFAEDEHVFVETREGDLLRVGGHARLLENVGGEVQATQGRGGAKPVRLLALVFDAQHEQRAMEIPGAHERDAGLGDVHIGHSGDGAEIDPLREHFEDQVAQQMALLRNPRVAPVLVAEVFRRAAVRVGELSGGQDGLQWILSISNEVFAEQLEFERRVRFREAVEAAAQGPTHEVLVAASDEDFWDAVAALTDRRRRVLMLLHMGQGMSVEVAAGLMGIGVSVVTGLRQAALRQLAVELGAEIPDTDNPDPDTERATPEVPSHRYPVPVAARDGETLPGAVLRAYRSESAVIQAAQLDPAQRPMLWSLVEHLLPRQQECFVRWFVGESFTEIAAAMGGTRDDVVQRLHGVVRRLAGWLSGEVPLNEYHQKMVVVQVALLDSERNAEVRGAVERLTDKQRDAFQRWFFQRQTMARMARDLEVTEEAVRKRLHHAVDAVVAELSGDRRDGFRRRLEAAVANDAHREVLARATDAEFHRAVEQLEDGPRTAIILRFRDELNFREVTEMMGCSENTLRAHLREGEWQLAVALGAVADEFANPGGPNRRYPVPAEARMGVMATGWELPGFEEQLAIVQAAQIDSAQRPMLWSYLEQLVAGQREAFIRWFAHGQSFDAIAAATGRTDYRDIRRQVQTAVDYLAGWLSDREPVLAYGDDVLVIQLADRDDVLRVATRLSAKQREVFEPWFTQELTNEAIAAELSWSAVEVRHRWRRAVRQVAAALRSEIPVEAIAPQMIDLAQLRPFITGVSGYRGLVDALREAIRTGVIQPGMRLPGTEGVAAELGLHATTVKRAYRLLRDDWYLVIRNGIGAVVVDLDHLMPFDGSDESNGGNDPAPESARPDPLVELATLRDTHRDDMVRRLTGVAGAEPAGELADQVFAYAAVHLDALRAADDAKAWLDRVAATILAEALTGEFCARVWQAYTRSHEPPAEVTLQGVTPPMLQAALKNPRLSDDHRAVLRLLHWGPGMSRSAVAQRLGWPADFLDRLAEQAVQRLVEVIWEEFSHDILAAQQAAGPWRDARSQYPGLRLRPPAMALDVARAAGVSTGVVNNVYTTNPGNPVHPETEAHVRQVAARLGYRPPRGARRQPVPVRMLADRAGVDRRTADQVMHGELSQIADDTLEHVLTVAVRLGFRVTWDGESGNETEVGDRFYLPTERAAWLLEMLGGHELRVILAGRQAQRVLLAQLRTAIDEGRIPAGYRLPGAETFAEHVRISPVLVDEVYAQLRDERLVYRRNSGTVVGDEPESDSHAESHTGRTDGRRSPKSGAQAVTPPPVRFLPEQCPGSVPHRRMVRPRRTHPTSPRAGWMRSCWRQSMPRQCVCSWMLGRRCR